MGLCWGGGAQFIQQFIQHCNKVMQRRAKVWRFLSLKVIQPLLYDRFSINIQCHAQCFLMRVFCVNGVCESVCLQNQKYGMSQKRGSVCTGLQVCVYVCVFR